MKTSKRIDSKRIEWSSDKRGAHYIAENVGASWKLFMKEYSDVRWYEIPLDPELLFEAISLLCERTLLRLVA